MQQLINFIETENKKKKLTERERLNSIREYLQVAILKSVYHTKYGRGISFIGGTCLRLCYNLKRYSEDLDFSRDRKIDGYSFRELNEIVARTLAHRNFAVEFSVSEDKVVQKSSIKVKHILNQFGITHDPQQKLSIKLEIDTHPVKISRSDIEQVYITKYNEIFPILKHTQRTLFAGKIAAFLNRPYTKGRDCYDLIWYLNQKTRVNYTFLNRTFDQAGLKTRCKDDQMLKYLLEEKIDSLDSDLILNDLTKFLEDPEEGVWLKDYKRVFEQLMASYVR